MASAAGGIPKIMVFRPSLEEMKDFSSYLAYMESQGANKAGLAKIIPPKEWCPRKSGYDDINLIIPAPISQMVTGRGGLYQQYNIQKKAMTVKDFKKLAQSDKYQTPVHFDYEDLERKYWKNITYNSPIYGADVSGSLYDKDVKEFNINHLNSILDLVGQDYGIKIEGVNTAYLYFGMWKTTFAWHTEDMDLYSINYLHFGAPKSWYVIPPEHGRRLERLAAGFFPASSQECSAFLRHKMTVISPHILKQYSIPVNKITQEPGEFMITFPYGYHAGFNHGFNCAESTNFALPRWIEYGKRASQCGCRKDCVKISMDVFVKKFQPDRYELWLSGKDIGAHPEDPSRVYAAVPPTKMEMAIVNRMEERKKSMASTTISKRHPIYKDKEKEGNLGDGNESDATEIYELDNDDVKPKKARVKKTKDKKKPPEKVKKEKKVKEKVKDVKRKSAKKKKEIQDISIVIEPLDHDFDLPPVLERMVPLENSEVERENVLAKLGQINQQNKPGALMGPFAHLQSNPWSMSTPYAETLGCSDSKKVDESATDHSQNLLTLPQSLDKRFSFSHNHQAFSPNKLMDPSHVYPSLTIQPTSPSVIPVLSPVNLSPKASVSNLCHSHQLLGAVTKTVFSTQTHKLSSVTSDSNVDNEKCGSGPLSPYSKYMELPQKSCAIDSMVPQDLTIRSKNESNESDFVPKQMPFQVMHSYFSLSPQEKSKCQSSVKKGGIVPRRHPVTKSPPVTRVPNKGDISDEDTSSNASEEWTEGWAAPYADLWNFASHNFSAEKQFNRHCSRIEPHCAVCILFKPLKLSGSALEDSEEVVIPKSSMVWIPNICFVNGGLEGNSSTQSQTDILDKEETNPLLKCTECNVCVHASCYGVTNISEEPWYCDRCSSKDLNVECCLCSLRGGALKPTTEGQWAHVLCACLVPEVLFENARTRSLIDVRNLKPQRMRLRCYYCFKTVSHFVKNGNFGACIQCTSGKCTTAFHVTCAHAAGVVFETCDWPLPIYITCTKHITGKEKAKNRVMPEVVVGSRVIAKHKNGRYYWCKISDTHSQVFYSVDFEDNSSSDNLYPSDIVCRDCTTLGPPEVGQEVKVLWTDNKVYTAVFRGITSHVMYTVTFEDESELTVKREAIYAEHEELPKKVKSRLSTATEMQHTDVFQKPSVDSGGKRTRMLNTKYQSQDIMLL